uniref:Polyketide synthase methyltransferase domain-containing protein n=1 Tax=Ditylum brightwellii TaxID=49249 RepID=A0A7S4QZB4_9STRA|mmetsp:Transcript_34750/g.46093  ORF Transcript_34750/g.46093 Transcript_34750/m.46093 type:complete len:412 (+) Transcript_34750:43-1278(+)
MSFLVNNRNGGNNSILSLLTSTPTSYNTIRPHHVAIVYGLYQLYSSSKFSRKLTDKILQLLSKTSDAFIPLVYKGLIPDALVRWGIRLRCGAHLTELRGISAEDELQTKMEIVSSLKTMPVAIETDAANEQHYEVPAAFYELCLGPRKKYSSGLWPFSNTTFEESEDAMLAKYCERAQVKDGMNIVDLGCGWGSLTLYLAEKFPNAQITGISNSHSQREHILKTAADRGLNVDNIRIVTCNVSDDKGALDVVKDNDLVMSIEMFEHMKNYSTLLSKVHNFLKPSGKLFVHIFTHKEYAYNFEDGWMAENFFTGGTMPSDDLLLYFAENFGVVNHWRVNGSNYEKTSNGWLNYLDDSWKKGLLQPVLAEAYGKDKEKEWYVNWRLFFLACAELFGYAGGEEWIVSHYLFERR